MSKDDTSSLQNPAEPGTERPDGNVRSEEKTPPETLGRKELQKEIEGTKPGRKRRNKFTCYTERETVVKKTKPGKVFTVKQMLQYMAKQRETQESQ